MTEEEDVEEEELLEFCRPEEWDWWAHMRTENGRKCIMQIMSEDDSISY